MATRLLYRTKLDVVLNVLGMPDVSVVLDHDEVYSGVINSLTHVCVDRELEPGNHVLTITHQSKKSNDADTELIIESITFNGITSPNFVWQGVYTPEYPEPWATEQRLAGCTLEPTLAVTNHLGWNGQWTLTFTAPIFTWIHQVEDLGWIHQ